MTDRANNHARADAFFAAHDAELAPESTRDPLYRITSTHPVHADDVAMVVTAQHPIDAWHKAIDERREWRWMAYGWFRIEEVT